jgi:hypothetical protein
MIKRHPCGEERDKFSQEEFRVDLEALVDYIIVVDLVIATYLCNKFDL